jgi:uncharacterized protein (DUF4213/DUF364 family)
MMKILDDIVTTLNLNADVRDIRQGVFQTAVYTRGCGLASTPHGNDFTHSHGTEMVKSAGSLKDKSAEELVKLAYSESPLEAAIGLAAINSLLDVDVTRCKELNASVVLKSRGENKKVAIIGHFPFIPQLREVAAKLWVIEKNPQPGDYPEEDAEKYLPEADVIGITGVTLINHTFEKLADYCGENAFVMILGGTTPLSPVLFDYGIDAISGTLITEPETVLDSVSQGATFRQLKKGIRLLTLEK